MNHRPRRHGRPHVPWTASQQLQLFPQDIVPPQHRAPCSETKGKMADVSTIPIAQQAYRLRVLQRSLVKVEGQGNVSMVAQLLEQAAKESGGAFTNRRELTGKGGGPLVTANVSREELREAVTSVRDQF